MGLLHRLTRSGHVHGDVARLFREQGIASGRILDLPSGKGANAGPLTGAGYSVVAADLFADFSRAPNAERTRCDMTQPLPFADGSFDGILHSEGIEHIDNQLGLLRELSRVLRPGGVLIVTTPNLLHLEARLSTLLCGHAHWRRAIVAESKGTWGDSAGLPQQYFGHVFLVNAYQLRFYLAHAGLEVCGVDTARYSLNSILLAPLMWLPVQLATRITVRGKRSGLPRDLQDAILGEVLDPAVLFGRKLVMLARKPLVPAPEGKSESEDVLIPRARPASTREPGTERRQPTP